MKPSIQGPLDQLAARVASLESQLKQVRGLLTSLSGTAAATDSAIGIYAGHGVFDVRAFGAKGDGVTDDTIAIQAALDAAGVVAGTVVIPANFNPYLFTNLKIPAYTKLRGEHMWLSRLYRIAGSSGSALQEKTVAEGNPYGATGIWIQDLHVNGNNTLGDGINLGNDNPNYALSTMAGMQNVSVWSFPSGSGFKINSNADAFHYLWADHNATGVYFGGGGANVLHSIFAEFNSVYQIQIADSDDAIFGIQIETDQSCSAHLRVEGLQNNFYGVYFGLGANAGSLVSNALGANRNAYYGVTVADNGHTWVDTVRHEAWGLGTGASGTVHSFVIGEGTGDVSWYMNGSTANSLKVAGDGIFWSGNAQVAGDTNLQRVGFYGTAASAKQTVTGSKGGNVALTGLLNALAAMGLITDSTT